MALLLGVAGSHAQSSEQLTNWRFSGNVDLDAEVLQDSRMESMFVGELILVTHPNLDSDSDCGSVLLLSENARGGYTPIRTLSSADFNRSCIEPDGFGFSVDYADGLLVIGAPGQIFIEADDFLPRGAVYVYRLDASSAEAALQTLAPLDRVPGTLNQGDAAWGTRVATDGQRILVQGNEITRDQMAHGHGRARSRTVSLLEQSGGDYELTQQFRGDTTVYGQDFLINDQSIVITNHTFDRLNEALFVPKVNFYLSNLEVYALDEGADLNVPNQTIPFLTEVRRFSDEPGDDRLLELDQLYSRGADLILFSTRFDFPIRGDFVLYELGTDNQFNEAGESFSTFQGIMHVGEQKVYINGFIPNATSVNQISITETFGQRLRQQVVASRSNGQLSGGLRSLQVNDENNLLLARNGLGDDIQLSVFSAVPALDPVITGTWWFGPQFDGQGVTLEVLVGNRLLLHWFTYDLSGRQMWMRGVGTLNNGVVRMQLNRPRGPLFPIDQFDPDDRVVEPWGTVEISFSDCRNAVLSYQSDEFGNNTLAMRPLTDSGFRCNQGFFINNQEMTVTALDVVGSMFDRSRSGEGFIFMPVARQPADGVPRPIVIFDTLGFWLTYDQQGNQAWYYLGQFTANLCQGNACPWFPIDRPRSTGGPIFGDEYNPADRITRTWGRLGPLEHVRGSGGKRMLQFSTPDGFGSLLLDELTNPIGY